MLDANDIQVLREMFGEHEVRFDKKLDRLRYDVSEKMELECTKLRDEFFVKLDRGLDKVRDDVIDVLNMNIIPQLNRFDARITRLERLQSQS